MDMVVLGWASGVELSCMEVWAEMDKDSSRGRVSRVVLLWVGIIARSVREALVVHRRRGGDEMETVSTRKFGLPLMDMGW